MRETSPTIAPLLVDERTAARLLSLSARTLFGLRQSAGLPFVKIGSRVMYAPVDLQRWIDARRAIVATAAPEGVAS